MARARKVVLAVVVVLVALVVSGWMFLGALVLALAAPGAPFDPAIVPPAPDYADPAAWSALPERDDAADALVFGVKRIDPQKAPVDVFYVHPTSYLGGSWNAAIDDATVNAATDAGSTRIQASAFVGCCSVYAPRYRQANMTAFTDPSDGGARAIALAGDDVIAAFHAYRGRVAADRPFIVASHSQGSVMALRLVREVIAAGPLRERMVAAYLIGAPISEQALGDVPVCSSARATGCVVTWNARSPDYRGGIEFVEQPPPPADAPPRARVCVNPLTWSTDEARAESGLGAVFWDSSGEPPDVYPGFAAARCEAGTLRVELRGPVPRDFMSRLLDHAMGDGNYHPIEYGLFWADLHANASARAEAFLAARAN